MLNRAITAPRRTLYHPRHGETVTLLETAAQSGGARTLLEVALCAAGGTAPQRNLARDERYELVAGTLTVHVGGEARRLRPGEVLVVAAGSEHHVVNDTLEEARYRLELSPGHEGYERALVVGGGLAADGLVGRNGAPLNPYHLAVLLNWSGIRPAEIDEAAERSLALLARSARAKRIDVALAERYC